MDKWDCVELKGFCTTKEAVNSMKRPILQMERKCQPIMHLMRVNAQNMQGIK